MEKASCIRPYAALRDKPKQSAEQHTQALFADPIDVVEQSNGWARPAAKVPLDTIQGQLAGGDSTLMFLQTMQVKASQITSIDQAGLRRITFELTVPATATEIWLDSIDIVLN